MADTTSMLHTSARALSSPSPREKRRHRYESTHVFSGWLFIEAHAKREFKWRFCVLDGVHFQVYAHAIQLCDRDTQEVKAACVRQHLLVHVERLHRINRGMLLVDYDGYGLWVHGTHDENYFEVWLAAIRKEVMNQSIRLTITRYGFVHQSSGLTAKESRACAYTGWLKIRRTMCRGWLVGPAQRMYCVLAGRHLSTFKLNIEGRWADLHGKIERVDPKKNAKWLQLTLDNGTIVLVMGRSDDVTSVWKLRIDAALSHEPRSSQLIGPIIPTSMPRRTHTC